MTRIFEDEDIAVCGVVVAELIHGAVSEKDIGNILDALSCFETLQFSGDWAGLGKLLYRLRKSGVTVPFSDAVIAMTAMEYGIRILTKDRHFKLIRDTIPELKLYELGSDS